MIIVQVGCFDGDDDVYKFVMQNKDKINRLIIVEPLLAKLKEAKARYAKLNYLESFNIAIVPDENIKKITLYYPKDLNHAQLTSFNKDNVRKFFSDQDISSFEIEALTINKLFSNLKLKNIDRLYVDTEGLDCKIILSLDLMKYNIKYIEYEYVHCDGVNNYSETGHKTESLLLSLGYNKILSPPFNVIFQK